MRAPTAEPEAGVAGAAEREALLGELEADGADQRPGAEGEDEADLPRDQRRAKLSSAPMTSELAGPSQRAPPALDTSRSYRRVSALYSCPP